MSNTRLLFQGVSSVPELGG